MSFMTLPKLAIREKHATDFTDADPGSTYLRRFQTTPGDGK